MKNWIFVGFILVSLFCLVWGCDSNDKSFNDEALNDGIFNGDSSSSGTDDEDENGESWKLVWSDDFDIDDYLDENVWSRIHIDSVGYWAEWCKYSRVYDELYDVKEGNLVLRGIYNKGDNAPYPDDTCTFITAGVRTLHKKTFFGGDYPVKLTIRSKMGSAQGAWPAFWMKPVSQAIQNKKGEIDILEHLDFNIYVDQTVHNYWTYYLHNDGNPEKHGKGVIDYPDDYNEYSVEIYPEVLYFKLNDRTILTYPHLEDQEYDDQFPYFIYPFFLMLDVQVGGSNVQVPDPDNGYPIEVYVDWVRYYEYK